MPDRITLSRAAGWRLPEGARVVTRSTVFGNPWVAGKDAAFWWPRAMHCGWQSEHPVPAGRIDAETAVSIFRYWMEGLMPDRGGLPVNMSEFGHEALRSNLRDRRALILSRLPELRGRSLACWCKPGCPCHADVLLEIAND